MPERDQHAPRGHYARVELVASDPRPGDASREDVAVRREPSDVRSDQAGSLPATCDGAGWCVKRDAAPFGEPWCNGAGRCVKGYARRAGEGQDEREAFQRLVGSLLDTYRPEGVLTWLIAGNRNFGGYAPRDLIRDGEWQPLLDEADRLAGGPLG